MFFTTFSHLFLFVGLHLFNLYLSLPPPPPPLQLTLFFILCDSFLIFLLNLTKKILFFSERLNLFSFHPRPISVFQFLLACVDIHTNIIYIHQETEEVEECGCEGLLSCKAIYLFEQAYKYHYSFQVLCAAASFVSAFKGRGLKKAFTFFTMTIKIKGIYKGFRYITQIFVVKERELEIGFPTDVKHVAHIGWDGQSGSSAPSWMNEYKTGPDFAVTSIGNSGSTFSPWSSQDFGERLGRQIAPDMFTDIPPSDKPNIPKQKCKKQKSASSPKSSSSSTRSSRAAKTKTKLVEGHVKASSSIEVA